MPLFLKSIDPTLDIFGNEQTLRFNTDQLNNEANLILQNLFTPLIGTNLNTGLAFVNSSLNGFRFKHEFSTSSVTFGNFYLECASRFGGNSSSIFKYDEQTDSLTFFKNCIFNNNTIVDQNYVDNHQWLTSDITDLDSKIASYNYINIDGLNTALASVSNAANNYTDSKVSSLGLSEVATTGILTRTAANTYVNRSVVSGSSNIVVTNGSGVSGNISVNLANQISVNAITISNAPTVSTDGVNKNYIDNLSLYSSRISDFVTAVRDNKPTDLALITSSFNANNNKIINLATPVNNNDAANKNYVDTSIITPSRISSYPNDSSLFLNGAGSWKIPQLADITTSLSIYRLSVNNTNTSATNTEIMFKKAGSNRLAIGTNNLISGSYLMSYSSPLRIGVNDIIGVVIDTNANWDFGDKDLVTTGTINAKTGTLRGNNISTFNSVTLVCDKPIDISNNKIINLATPVNNNDAANKSYVDSTLNQDVITILQGINTSGRRFIVFKHDIVNTIVRNTLFTISLPSAYRNSSNEILSLVVLGPVDADNTRGAYGSYSNTKTLLYGMDTTGRYVQFKCTSTDISAGSVVTAIILGVS